MKHILSRLRHSGFVQTLIKISITIFIFWLVFRGVDFEHILAALKNQNQALFFITASLLGTQIIIGVFRWRIVVNALGKTGHHSISVMTSMRIYYISMFFTCCLPGAVGGDVVRVWLGRKEQLPFSISVNSVIIDRLMALVALIMMVVMTLPSLGSAAGFNTNLLLPLFGALVVLSAIMLLCGERMLEPVKQHRPFSWILYLLHSVKMILKDPVAFVTALFLALVGQVVYATSAWVLAQSLSINMTLMQSITLMPPVMLATTLPISIGGWGVREAGIVSMLGLIAVPQASALLLSLELGFTGIMISLPASLLWLAYRRRSPNINLSDMTSIKGNASE